MAVLTDPTLINDPLGSTTGLSLTPWHIVVLLCAGLSLLISQLDIPLEFVELVGMWRRAMVLLVFTLILHAFVTQRLSAYKAKQVKQNALFKLSMDIRKKDTLQKEKDAWENISAHPSQFLTTKDGKPRLFPFPLGKAAGNSLKGELWWEAGNSAHVGHFNQRESPEAREALRLEMEDKEEERAAKAKKAIEAYETLRSKWNKRMSNLKILMGIIVLSLFHKPAAVFALAALIYYVIVSELAGILKPEEDEKPEPAKERQKLPDTPGMGMTYIYEPTATGVREAGAIPMKAPAHRLMTSTDSRYAR